MSIWLNNNKLELQTAALYFVTATLWILLSDQIAHLINVDGVLFQSTKGILFVSVTAFGLFTLMSANRREHLQHAEQLARSENMQQLLFQNNPQPMWIYDQSSLQFLQVNEAAINAYGYTASEFAAMTIADIRPAEDVPKLLDDVKQDRPILQDSGEWRHKHKDGRIMHVHIISHHICFNNQEAVLVAANDITEKKQLERRLQQQKALRNRLEREIDVRDFRREFMSMMSHQFRTPLSVIMTSTDLMARHCTDWRDKTRFNEYKNRVQRQVANLVDMLNEIMEAMETETLKLDFKPQPVDIQSYMQTFIADSYDSKRLHLRLNGPPAQTQVDPKLFNHAIDNLISNALKYSPADSIVTVEVNQHDDEVWMRVQDNGIGIPAENIPKLFEPFYRGDNVEQRQGNGLGLSIAAQTVELHGGKIDVESRLGEGTTFTIRLPIQSALSTY